MKKLENLEKLFCLFEEWLCIAMMLIMFLAVGINIVLNWTMRIRLGELEEIGTAAYMFCCYAALGWMYKKNDLSEVGFIMNTLKPRVKWWFDLFRYVFLVFFSILMIYNSLNLCRSSLDKTLPASGIPYIYLDVCTVFGFSMFAIRAFIDVIKHVKTVHLMLRLPGKVKQHELSYN